MGLDEGEVVVPGVGVNLIPEIGDVEEAGSPAGGVKDLLLEQQGTLVHQAVD